MGKRSLYYHARNYWLYAFKNCSWKAIITTTWQLAKVGMGLGKSRKFARDATGTIGLEKSVKGTPGGYWIVLKAMEKDGEIGEDRHRALSEEVQKLTDAYVAKVDDALKAKEAEIMQV